VMQGEQSENDPEDYLQPTSESSASGLQSPFEVGNNRLFSISCDDFGNRRKKRIAESFGSH